MFLMAYHYISFYMVCLTWCAFIYNKEGFFLTKLLEDCIIRGVKSKNT